MEEALEVEPGALMIWSVIVEVVRGREGKEEQKRGAESLVGLCYPHSVLSDMAEHTVALWGVWLSLLGW